MRLLFRSLLPFPDLFRILRLENAGELVQHNPRFFPNHATLAERHEEAALRCKIVVFEDLPIVFFRHGTISHNPAELHAVDQ